LRRGRSQAKETDPVKPVAQEWIDAIEPYVSRQVWVIIQLQLLTAARPGELVIMRPCDIDRSGSIWLYTPQYHKTEHHGHERKIYIGPRGQMLLQPFLLRAEDAYCFSPVEAEAQRRVKMHRNRKTPLSCGALPGTNVKAEPLKEPGDHYDVDAYRRSITYGCAKAFPLPEPLAKHVGETKEKWRQRLKREKLTDQVKVWRREHSWHPHQLRHNAATFVRKEFGLETARIILGHRSTVVTEIYAELDEQKAIETMEKIG